MGSFSFIYCNMCGAANQAQVTLCFAWAWLAFSQGSQAPQALPATPPPTPYVDPYRLYTYRGHAGSVYAVAWSPTSLRIASGGADGTVQVWNAP